MKIFWVLIFLLVAQLRLWAASGANPLNVLFIAVDDLKPTLGCYGDTLVYSPHIDSLASRGTVFWNNYCQQAVCAPSRASLLTGWRPDRTQVWDLKTLIRDKNPDVVTLPEYFKEHGYETAAVGKVFDPRSVDKEHDAVSWTLPYRPAYGNRWLTATQKVSTEIDDAPDSAFVDGHILAESLDLMNILAKKNKPFFLAVGFKKPHLPFVAPKRDWDRYPREKMPLAPFQQHSANAPAFAFQPGWELRSYVDIPKEGRLPDEKQRELVNGYYACATFIDRQVGRLLRHLQELNLAENTIVVLWGDHGWHLGDHLIWCKHTNFEQATRAPLIFSVPGLKGGQVARTLSEFVDVFPTLCDLTGLPVPEGLDGVSLVPALRDTSVRVKTYAVSQYHRTSAGQKLEGYAIRTERYRYVEWLRQDIRETEEYDPKNCVATELYDYQIDPLETVSRASFPEYRSVVENLRGILKAYFAEQRVKIQVPVGENFLRNPGFESGTANWTAKQCLPVVVDSPVHSGQHALRLTGRQKDFAGVFQNVTSSMQRSGPGRYAVTGYFRAVGSESVLGKIKIRVTASGSTHYFGAVDTISAVQWRAISDTLDLTWDGTLEEADFFVQTANGYTGNFFVDDLSLSFVENAAGVSEERAGSRAPTGFFLQNFPNPFNPATTIFYTLARPGRVRLVIYNSRGQKVRVLQVRKQGAGSHSVSWDGKSRSGSEVPSGIYFCRLEVNHRSLTRKMLLLR